MSWTKHERMKAVLSGEIADRPPVTAYRHFPGMELEGSKLAEAMVGFQRKYDWDWMKVNPAAVYYYEVWGNEYDYNNYESNVPHRNSYAIHGIEDMEKITIKPGNAEPFARQLEAVRLIRAAVGSELPVFHSIFSPAAILLNLCGDRSPGRYRESARDGILLLDYFHNHREETHRALRNITETMYDYTKRSIQAGADGIFFACMGLAREGYLTLEEWEEFVKPYDKALLEALNGKPAILHTCGIYGNPERFVDYGVQAIHWAESAPGNPPIAGSQSWLGKIAAMGGVDERLFGTGAEKKISIMAEASVKQNRNRPFLLAPECTVDMTTSDAELNALREAAEV